MSGWLAGYAAVGVAFWLLLLVLAMTQPRQPLATRRADVMEVLRPGVALCCVLAWPLWCAVLAVLVWRAAASRSEP